ncbi:DUF2848 family protein [Sciscionella marina]|uniref:DUF2848 family protein n=1 Tax=Sciscionella marina TaxID=508770 RepID=UPI000376FD5F|nr:DUF2848 family protein [Sciscionella marina]
MHYTLETKNDRCEVTLRPGLLLLAGYTGRDTAAVAAHIEELAGHGIAPPERVPSVFAVSGNRLTTAERIEVIGDRTAGEAEFVLFQADGEVLVGVGSDHTDRELEANNVVKAKQACEKPVGATLWPLSELEGHWDELLLRAQVRTDQGWRSYQDGSVAEMLAPRALLAEVAGRVGETAPHAVFSGTIPIIGGEFGYGNGFRVTLEDPVLGRSLHCEYGIRSLPESSL